MKGMTQGNPFVPQQDQGSTTHVMNVQELQEKDTKKYVAKNWYDKLPFLLLLGLLVSALFAGLSFLINSFSFLIYLTPLSPIIFFAIWLIRRLTHGKNFEPIKDRGGTDITS